jgi:hypothetical protein
MIKTPERLGFVYRRRRIAGFPSARRKYSALGFRASEGAGIATLRRGRKSWGGGILLQYSAEMACEAGAVVKAF